MFYKRSSLLILVSFRHGPFQQLIHLLLRHLFVLPLMFNEPFCDFHQKGAWHKVLAGWPGCSQNLNRRRLPAVGLVVEIAIGTF